MAKTTATTAATKKPTRPAIERVFICPGCDKIAVRWADHHNTRCGACSPG